MICYGQIGNPALISGQQMGTPTDRNRSAMDKDQALNKNDGAMLVSEKKKLAAEAENQENQEEDGWELVRARKKRPIGSGAPLHSHTRPDKQRNKSDGEKVSSAYRAKRNLSSEKVPISAPSLNMEVVSNSQSCSGKDGCPLSLAAVLDGGGEPPGQESGMLTPELSPLAAQKVQSVSYTNGEKFSYFGDGVGKGDMTGTPNDHLNSEKDPGVSAPHWCNLLPLEDEKLQPVESSKGEKILISAGKVLKEHSYISPSFIESHSETSKDGNISIKAPSSTAGKNWAKGGLSKAATKTRPAKPVFSFGSRPSSLGSTAGHTPYKSRLTTMARELRNRQLEQSSGMENSNDIPSTEDTICSSPPLSSKAGPIGHFRTNPHKTQQMTSQEESGQYERNISYDKVGEEIEPFRGGLDPPDKCEQQLHMEMPNYLMTRKILMEQDHLDHILANEKPMMELEDRERETRATAKQGGDARCETLGHGQAHSPM